MKNYKQSWYTTIVKLKLNRIGCSIGSSFLGCVMYADDIILLSSSVAGLQCMLDTCFETCTDLYLKFNCNKSFCIFFGPAAKFTLAPMLLGQDHIQWVNSIKYLGVIMVSGKIFRHRSYVKIFLFIV